MSEENIDKLIVFSVLADNINVQAKQMNLSKNDIIFIRVEENVSNEDIYNFHGILTEVMNLNDSKVLFLSKAFDINTVPMSVLKNWKEDIERVLKQRQEDPYRSC